jgi:hypothetical protein
MTLQTTHSRLLAAATILAVLLTPVLTAAQERVPPGTRATLEMTTWVSSKDAVIGDIFEAKLVSSITSEGMVVVPEGATFVGRVAAVERAGGMSKSGKLTLVIDRLVSGDGESAPAPGTITGLQEGGDLKGKGEQGKKAAIGGGIGGIVGAIVGGTTGLLVGLAVGVGGAIAGTDGGDITLPEGTELLVKFDQEINVTWSWRAQ